MSENGSRHVGGFLAAFAAGTLLGAGMALIYAPHSGRKTRDLLAQRAREAKDKVGGALQSTKEKTGSALHQARAKVGSALHGAKAAIREKKTGIVAAVAAGREALRGQKKHSSNPT